MSSKKKLCVDSKIIYEEKSYISNLKHKFKIENYFFKIHQKDLDEYELTINNIKFEDIMEEQKTTSTTYNQHKEMNKNYFENDNYQNMNVNHIHNIRNDENFFEDGDDGDFDFSGGNNKNNNRINDFYGRNVNHEEQKNKYEHNKNIFASISNFSSENNINNINQFQQANYNISINTNNNNLLLDMNDNSFLTGSNNNNQQRNMNNTNLEFNLLEIGKQNHTNLVFRSQSDSTIQGAQL
jgi:hypothetical protein